MCNGGRKMPVKKVMFSFVAKQNFSLKFKYIIAEFNWKNRVVLTFGKLFEKFGVIRH